MRENKKQFSGSIMLMICAMIWGVAFVAQSAGMDHVGPSTFNGVRNFIACAALLPVILFRSRKDPNMKKYITQPQKRSTLILGGALCGVFLCAASLFQQYGIKEDASAGKAGFLTALYIVIVPVLGIFVKKVPGIKVWIGVALALAGTYLLSVKDGFSIAPADVMLIICAVLFSFHILVVDHMSPKTDGVMLSWIQFFVSGVISMVIAFILEQPDIISVIGAWLPLLYTGVLSSGVAFTLQILGQRKTSPTLASLIMSLESVFAAVAGWLILGQGLLPREIWGCVLVFTAVVIAQLPPLFKKKRAEVN